MDTQYYKGTAKGKINLALYILGSVIVYFLLKYLWFKYLPEPIDNSEQAVLKYSNNVATAITVGGFIVFGIYLYFFKMLYNFSNRIKESTQYPPPNTHMPFTVKLLTGEKALKHAKGIYYGSFMFIFLGLLKLGVSIYSAQVLRELTTSF